MRHGNKSDSLKSNNPRPSREPNGEPLAPKSSSARTAVRFDRPGHLADDHAQRLLRLSKRRPPDDFAFLLASRGNTDDDLAEELAEQAVSAMTTGGDTWMESMDKTVDEEEGGPFVETRASREFARGAEHEVDGFLREALPTTRSGVKGRTQKRR
jgi:hypothetical protein